jgi:hypothetical protein
MSSVLTGIVIPLDYLGIRAKSGKYIQEVRSINFDTDIVTTRDGKEYLVDMEFVILGPAPVTVEYEN